MMLALALDPSDGFRQLRSGCGTRPRQRALGPFFLPKNVAVIGATEKVGSVGRTVLLNLSHGAFADRVYAVNPKHNSLRPPVASIWDRFGLGVRSRWHHPCAYAYPILHLLAHHRYGSFAVSTVLSAVFSLQSYVPLIPHNPGSLPWLVYNETP